jgi:hypothetical protein
MATVGVAAHEKQSHSFFSPCSCLEKDSFTMLAFGTSHALGARESRIRCNILEHLGSFICTVKNFVPVHTVVVCNFLMITVPACIQQHLLLSVFIWIQYVVALTAKLHGTHDASKV